MSHGDEVGAGQRAAKQAAVATAALLVAATRQMQTQPGTPEHTESAGDVSVLLRELLSVENLTPELALMSVAQCSSAIVSTVAHRYGIDPVGLTRDVLGQMLGLDVADFG